MPNVLLLVLMKDESRLGIPTDGTALVTDTADWPTHHRTNQKPKGFFLRVWGRLAGAGARYRWAFPPWLGCINMKLHWLLFRGSRPVPQIP